MRGLGEILASALCPPSASLKSMISPRLVWEASAPLALDCEARLPACSSFGEAREGHFSREKCDEIGDCGTGVVDTLPRHGVPDVSGVARAVAEIGEPRVEIFKMFERKYLK